MFFPHPFSHTQRPPLKGDWKKNRSWLQVFYFNVFFACVSFSIIMPSLWLYLQDMGSDKTFLAWVVAIYSVRRQCSCNPYNVMANSKSPSCWFSHCVLLYPKSHTRTT